MATGCKKFGDTMQAALDRELEGEDRARFDDHLASCAACASQFRAFELSLALFEAIPAPQPGPSFAAGAVRKARLAKQAHARRNLLWAWGMAAGLLVASLAVIGTWTEVFSPLLPALVTGIPRAVSGSIALIGGLGSAFNAMASTLMPLGEAAAALSWKGLLAVFPTYVMALSTMILLTLVTRRRRPAVRLPVLSL
ncbi:MAG: zf-HC2 domain-containing protein [Pseudomonadota bacterium]